MSKMRIECIPYQNTLKAFQPFYKGTLTKNDAIEIKDNLSKLLKVFNDNKQYLTK